MKHPWKGAREPFQIYGNLYFVGTEPASTHLIDTGEGLIVLDPGYPQSLYLVIDGIWRLGFRPEDVKIILHSHGHYDHLGGTRALAELTGAKTYISALDAPYADGTYRAYDPNGAFMMLAKVEDGVMSTIKSFFEI